MTRKICPKNPECLIFNEKYLEDREGAPTADKADQENFLGELCTAGFRAMDDTVDAACGIEVIEALSDEEQDSYLKEVLDA